MYINLRLYIDILFYIIIIIILRKRERKRDREKQKTHRKLRYTQEWLIINRSPPI